MDCSEPACRPDCAGASPAAPAAALGAQPPAPAEHSLPGVASENSGVGQLSAASGALSGMDTGDLSSRQQSMVHPQGDLSRSISMQKPPSPLHASRGAAGGATEAEAAAAAAVKGPVHEAPAATPEADMAAATGGIEAEAGAAEAGAAAKHQAAEVGAASGATEGLAGTVPDAAPAKLPAPTSPESPPAGSAEADSSSRSSISDEPLPASANTVASGSPRLSVRQLLEAREREREWEAAAQEAAGGAALAAEASSGSSMRSPPRHARARSSCAPFSLPSSLPASRSQSRLASCHSSPALSARRFGPGGRRAASPPLTARAESSAGSSTHLGSDHSYVSSLLRPTASLGVEATESRRHLLQQKSMPCAYQPQVTLTAPFKLSCDERAKYDHTRVADGAKLNKEERDAREAEAGRKQLEQELKQARERCRRSLTSKPLRHTPQPEASAPQFKPFKLQSLERHEVYARQFAHKMAEQQLAEDMMHTPRGHGSRSSSRIGALHGSSSRTSPGGKSPEGGSPPALATEERAARHAQRSAERRQREEAEAARKEAERAAQLTAEEREEEEERRQHRFKARAMPNFTSLPVFTPDKAKAKPATVPREFKFNVRFAADSSKAQ